MREIQEPLLRLRGKGKMSEEVITAETIEAANAEIEATTADEVKKVKDEYAEKMSELEKKIEELTPKPVEPEDPAEVLKKQLEEQKQQMESMKVDFDKKMETISMRKSVSVTDDATPTTPAEKKGYTELTESEKDQADRAYFSSLGYQM